MVCRNYVCKVANENKTTGHVVEKYATVKKIRHNLQVEVTWYILGQGQVVFSGTCPSIYHMNSYSSVHTLHLFLSIFTLYPNDKNS